MALAAGAGALLGTGSTASTIFSALSVVGSVLGGIQQLRQANDNADQFEADAEAQRVQTAQQVEVAKDQRRKEIGRIKARQAASGIVVGEGSPLLALEESFFNLTRDIQNTQLQGDVNARRSVNKARIERQRGSDALTGSIFKAGTSLLGSAIRSPTRSAPPRQTNLGDGLFT